MLGAPDAAVAPAFWWAASNWRNRFTVPITFGPPPNVCDILDSRAPTGFYGSELLSQAALQWAPAYCLNKQRFKFQFNNMPDEAGWNLMTTGGGPAALVSTEHQVGADPVGYAPTAVTGFAIGYVADKPNNTGEYTQLKMNARLLAKLLTLSYAGSTFGEQHPGMADNPWALQADPEFQKLNPGLPTGGNEAGAALLMLANSSDIVEQLTSYIATDKDAMDFIAGKADPWGMKVNPTYKNLSVPFAEWPLLDDFTPHGSTQCQLANPSIYLNNVAAPVTTLAKISSALIDAWPNTQTRCDTDISTTPPTYKLGRVDRQPYGNRFLLGIVSLGDAARYGLRTAALETTKGHYVAPSNDSLGAALKLEEQKDKLGPFVLDQNDVRKSRTAYPGTMVVYTAARTHNLDQADADKVAQFIRISTTEGQEPGSGNGELPGGFLPIEKTGATAQALRLRPGGRDRGRGAEEAGHRPDRRPVRRRTVAAATPAAATPVAAITPPGVPDDTEPVRQREPVRRADRPAGRGDDARDPAGRLRPGRWPAAAADPARRDRLRRDGRAPGRRARGPRASMTTTMDPTEQHSTHDPTPPRRRRRGDRPSAKAPKPAKQPKRRRAYAGAGAPARHGRGRVVGAVVVLHDDRDRLPLDGRADAVPGLDLPAPGPGPALRRVPPRRRRHPGHGVAARPDRAGRRPGRPGHDPEHRSRAGGGRGHRLR